MVQSTTGTLIRPPPTDPSKSTIENVLELTPIRDLGPDIFTNTRPLWHPPGARGIYGGAAIAQSLAAAQLTIPPPSPANNHAVFLVHSMHCYFVLAGDASIPVLYHVERVREGKSFMTRTVQARQRGKCIFTTTLSFVREGSAGKEVVEHEVGLPDGAEKMLRDIEEGRSKEGEVDEDLGEEQRGPFESRRMEVTNSEWSLLSKMGAMEESGRIILGNTSPHPHTKRTRQWLRARGHISSTGPQAHLSALAYMSDSYFIGTISRVHNLWRFSRPSTTKALDAWDKSLAPSKIDPPSKNKNQLPPTPRSSIKVPEIDPPSDPTSSNQRDPYVNAFPPSSAPSSAPSPSPVQRAPSHPLHNSMASLESRENSPYSSKTIGMMVSLDHTIFFHRPRSVKADEWTFSEMESPWSGDGRGLVLQRIWDRNGRLLATCVQEGLCRLAQTSEGVQEKGKL